MTTTVVKTIGAGGDYSLLQAWEDACPANLVAVDQVWQGEIKSATDGFSGLLVVSGTTTDATRYKHLTAAAGASFIDNAAVQVNALRFNKSHGAWLEYVDGYNTCVNATEPYFRISRLQISCIHNNELPLVNTGGGGDVNQMIIAGGESNRGGVWVDLGTCRNTLVQGTTNNSASGVTGSRTTWTNVTVVNTSGTVRPSAFQHYYNNPLTVIKNCAAFGYTNFENNNAPGTITNCITDSANPPSGCTAAPYSAATFISIVSGSEDFRPAAKSLLIGAGAPDLVNASLDIVGNRRSSNPTVGAWEYLIKKLMGAPLRLPGLVQTQQPQGVVQIDWSNPICRSLGFASTGDFTFDAATVTRLAAAPGSGTISQATAKVGRGTAFTGNAAISSPRAALKNGDMTVLFVGNPTSGAGFTSNIFSQSGAAGAVWFGANTDEFNGIVPGQLTLGLLQTGVDRSSIKAAGATDGTLSCYLIKKTAGTGAAFKNGKALTTVTTGSLLGAPCAAADTTSIGGDNANSGSSFNASMFLVLVFNRALSDAECASISANPWQIFRSIARSLPASLLVVPGRRTALIPGIVSTQPPQNTPTIDRSNTFGARMRFGYLGNTLNPRDAVKGRRNAGGSTTATLKANVGGLGLKTTVTSDLSWYGREDSVDPYLNSFTAHWVGFLVCSNSNATEFIAYRGDSYGWRFSNQNYGPTTASLQIIGAWSGGGPSVHAAVPTASLHSATVVYDKLAGMVSFYVDGVLASAPVAFSPDPGQTGGNERFYVLGDSAGSFTNFAGVFAGALTAAEVKLLASNPYQVFKAPQRELFLPPAVQGRLMSVPGPAQTQQPQGVVRIDPYFAKMFRLGGLVASAASRSAVIGTYYDQGTLTKVVTPYGYAERHDDGVTLQKVIGVSKLTEPYFCLFVFSANSAPISVSNIFVADHSSNANAITVSTNASGSLLIRVHTILIATVPVAKWAALNSLAITVSATEVSYYLNGIGATITQATAISWFGDNTSVNGQYFYTYGPKVFLIGSGHVYDPISAQSLSANPWQLFKSASRQMPMPIPVPSRLAMIPGMVQTQQPQVASQFDNSIGADFVWNASMGALVGPKISSTTASIKSTKGGVGISNGYATLNTNIPSMHTTTWTECGVIWLDGANALHTVSGRAEGQAIVFRPDLSLIDVVIWGVADVNISNGTLPFGLVHYVVKRSGALHTVWLNGKLYGTASDASTPLAYAGNTPAIGAQASGGAYTGVSPILSTSAILAVVRTPRSLSDAMCQSLSANHWQLFKAPQRELFLSSSTISAPTVSGPMQYTALIAEILASIDANTSIGNLIAGVSEMASALDTSSPNGTVAASMPESGTAADTQSGVSTMPASQPEVGSASDTQTGSALMPASQPEVGSVSDTQTGIAAMTASQTDSAVALDQNAINASGATTINDIAAASDTQTGSALMPASQPEVGSASDTQTGAALMPASRTDVVTASDTTAGVAAMTTSQPEVGSASDQQTGSAVMPASQPEVGSVVDTQTGSALMPTSQPEFGSVADSQTGIAAMTASQTDAGSVLDQPNVVASGSTSLIDAISASESQTGAASMFATQTDVVSASDTPNVFATFATGMTELGVVLENPVSSLFSTRDISELMAASELIQSIAAYVVMHQEIAVAADASFQGGNSPGLIIENGAVVDVPVGVGAFFASRTDSIPATDQYTPSAKLAASVIDIAEVVDSATSMMSTMLATADTLHAADNMPSYLTYLLGVIEIGTALEDMAIALGIVYPTTGLSRARTFKIAAEDRRMKIAAENRRVVVTSEDRSITN